MNESFADHLDSLDRLLNVNEVCALLGLHHDTLYRWVRAKEIPVIRIGTAAKPLLRFSPKELATWVREAPYFFHGPSRFVAHWMEIQVFHLMDDFQEAVKQLPVSEQRQLLADIRDGKSDDPTFACEDAE